MPFGVTNRVQLRFKPEASFGTTPGTGNHYPLRITDEALKYAIRTTQSNELRSDRQITDLVQIGAGAEGSVGFEFSYGEFDHLLASSLQNSWSVIGTNGAYTGTATFASTSVTFSGSPGLSNISSGQYFRIDDGTSANSGWYLASAATATSVTITGGTFATGTRSATIQAARVANGTTQSSYSIERYNADLTLYGNHRGMTPSTLQLNLAPGAILNGNIAFMGQDQQAVVGSSYMPGTSVASLTNSVYNSVANVFSVLEGGTSVTGVRSLTLNVNNNLRGQEVIGTLGYAGIGAGQSVITGTLELYFQNATLYNKFVNNTASSLAVRVSASSTGIGYVLRFPNVKYTDSGTPTPGANQDIILSQPFQALRDSSTNAQMLIDRGGDAVTLWS